MVEGPSASEERQYCGRYPIPPLYAQAEHKSWTLLGSTGLLRMDEAVSQFCMPLEAGDVVTTVLDLTQNEGTLSFELNGGEPVVAASGMRRWVPFVPTMDVWAHGSMRLLHYEATKMEAGPHGSPDQRLMGNPPALDQVRAR